MKKTLCFLAASMLLTGAWATPTNEVEFADVPLDVKVYLPHLTNLVGLANTASEFRNFTNQNSMLTKESDPDFKAWNDKARIKGYGGPLWYTNMYGEIGFANLAHGVQIGEYTNGVQYELMVGNKKQFDSKGMLNPSSIINWDCKQDTLVPTNGIEWGEIWSKKPPLEDYHNFSEDSSLYQIQLDKSYVSNLVDSGISSWTNAALVVSNEILSVEVQTVAGPTSVWSSSMSSGAGSDREIASLRSQIATLTAKVAALEAGGGASLWNSYAADGTKNPEPEYMTMLNRPTTMFASGFSWQTSGAFSVLSQSGSVAFVAEDGGGFRLGPNSTNYFGFVTGGSIVVGANCDSFTIEDTTGGKVAKITYPYTSGDFPTLWFSPDLSIDFAAQEGIVWVDNMDGTCTATAPATGESGFWYATTVKSVNSIFKSTMPARFLGGVIATMNDSPVVYDSVIEIQQGGSTYRLPAEAVK